MKLGFINGKIPKPVENDEELEQWIRADCMVRNQILMMEPLPNISKAYSMILRVEKQREVSAGLSTAIQNMAMQDLKTEKILAVERDDSATFTILLVYVDDILVAGNSEAMIIDVKKYLDSLFTIKDLGIAKYFLGLEIARSLQSIAVTQTKYISDILQDVGLLQAKTVTTPLPPGIQFSAEAGNALPNPAPYRRLIGRLLYLGFTRPDIAHATQQLSQYLQHPCKEHWDAATHVLRYLKGTMTKDLFFPVAGPLELRAYCDADWASCKDTRRSLTGYCIFFSHGLISWKTKKQTTVSRSTAEAEYRSMGATGCELTRVYNIMHDLQRNDSRNPGSLRFVYELLLVIPWIYKHVLHFSPSWITTRAIHPSLHALNPWRALILQERI
ncbi:Retrovirus-related Pol polyprotein from transposon RE1 [Sesamum angolense]|uniref:Retrovirus-related Pol polyprotein from transposon RE1 n=1 Tax=Sesamum angolense TaxID=2727404 RepID=A0AAE2BHT1_9LAMI|nr:Retrovirus-related Pol polyprotein from transposon RE1 [Sesamum angolense]